MTVWVSRMSFIDKIDSLRQILISYDMHEHCVLLQLTVDMTQDFYTYIMYPH